MLAMAGRYTVGARVRRDDVASQTSRVIATEAFISLLRESPRVVARRAFFASMRQLIIRARRARCACGAGSHYERRFAMPPFARRRAAAAYDVTLSRARIRCP